MKLFALLSNGKKYKELTATSLTELKNVLEEDRNIYKACKITIQEIGIYFSSNGIKNLIRYEDLKLNTRKEVRTLKQPMVNSVLTNNFRNDTIALLMVERGLLNRKRTNLTNKGIELKMLLTSA